MKGRRQILGRTGEEMAEEYLEQHGFKIVRRNFRCRLGEIDLVALHRGVLVFVEVKTRTADHRGSPLESVDARKQMRCMRAATFYLSRHGLHGREARFDVVGVSMRTGTPVIEHVSNAFDFREKG